MNNEEIMISKPLENMSGGGYKVLSLCDGMSCGQIAFERAGIKVDKYYASEIKDIGIKVTKSNFPNTIHVGDVNKIKYANGILYTDKGEYKTEIDIVIFGSPCQTFSIAMKSNLRVGLSNKEKSGLFIECNRILKEINPKYFFMENVARMKQDDEDFISKLMGVRPQRINSSVVSAQLRDRLYWTNIPTKDFDVDARVELQDIIEHGYSNRNKSRALLVSDSRPLTTPLKMFHRYYSAGFTTLIFKSKQHFEDCKQHYDTYFKGLSAKEIESLVDDSGDISVYNGVRYMTQRELERCQTVTSGYTQCLTRNEAADVLGDGWTVDVIVHILKGLVK